MRRILAITGIRSEYDILFPVIKALRDYPRLKVGVIVTGAHLSKRHGYTVNDIKKDGFNLVGMIKNLSSGDRDMDRVKGLAVQLLGLCRALDKKRPDLLLVVGDREEAINTALIGQYANIPVAHISGGDRVVGNADDQIRHAVTKLAHIHFVTNKESAVRVKKMGEQDFRIFNVGDPGLDRLLQVPGMAKDELLRYYGFRNTDPEQPLLLVIQHPLSTEIDSAYSQMKETMEAIKALRINTVISYPNSDPGSQVIIRCIEEYRGLSFVKLFRNIQRLQFVNTLRYASCLIGNSSAGIMEAPLLKLPTVNIGNRQKGRLHGKNIEFVPHDRERIKRAIRKAVFDKRYRGSVKRCSSPYGDGTAARKIAKILAGIPIDKRLLIKDMTY